MSDPMKMVVVISMEFDPETETPSEVMAKDVLGRFKIKRPAQVTLSIDETADAICEVLDKARVGNVDDEVLRHREESTHV